MQRDADRPAPVRLAAAGRRAAAAAAFAVAASAGACGDPGHRIVVLDWDESSGGYLVRGVEFQTLRDVETLSGTATRIVAGARVELTAEDLERAGSEADLIERAVRDQGHAVRLAAAPGDDGWVPLDYHSLAMASIYYHLERAAALFQELGFDTGRLGVLPTWYLVRFRLDLRPEGPLVEASDNAGYSVVPGLRGFLVLVQRALRDLPLGLNRGVMVHEYGHAVFAELVPESEGVLPQQALPLLSVNEGAADFFAAVATGDADFLRFSITPESVERLELMSPCPLGADRDLGRERRLTDEIVKMNVYPDACPNPYAAGSVLASALWEVARERGRRETAEALLDAIADLSDYPPDTVTLATLPDLFARRAGPEVCPVLLDRFAPVADGIRACRGAVP